MSATRRPPGAHRGTTLTLLAAILCLTVPTASGWGQIGGVRQFPQTRGLSGLPGGGFAVRPDGRLGFDGALALSTPIAYSLAPRKLVLTAGNMGFGRGFEWFDRTDDERDSNGTAALLFGLKAPGGTATVSAVTIDKSPKLIYNLHYQPSLTMGKLTLAAGLQDAFDDSNTKIPLDRSSARSLYVVGTYDVGAGTYVSAGFGTQRFRDPFVNACTPVMRGVRAVVEQDGYGWNGGLAFRLRGMPLVAHGEASVFLGFVKGKYPTWTVGGAF